MTHDSHQPRESARQRALTAPNPSVRLQAAFLAGTHPDPDDLDLLLGRCAVEPDFFVRDTLSWALTRQDRTATVDRLLAELRSGVPQARSQALHTLSKIGDRRAWEAVAGFLQDPDDQIARAAWRAAVALVPDGSVTGLAATLATRLGRGGPDLQRSLSRALAALGDPALAALEPALASAETAVRAHALATRRLLHDPDEGFAAAIAEANRIIALQGAPLGQDSDADR
ncbi:MAG: HEAT repeat domain-containing protein [Propionicimonas sp.]|nr:HEAT repeat domain-containing protein [Propionicimonas sp.]